MTTPQQAVERALSSEMAQGFGWGPGYALSPDERTAWVLREDGTAVAALTIEQFGQYYGVDGFEACSEGTGDESTNPTAGRRGSLPDGGAASCAESYDPAAVARRGFAFDGVVVAVGDSVSDRGDAADMGLPGVTFAVREWFSGGVEDTVTVDVQPPTVGLMQSSEAGYAYGIGSRLLVSGEARWGGPPLDSAIAWGCGFSRYYDAETALAWRVAQTS